MGIDYCVFGTSAVKAMLIGLLSVVLGLYPGRLLAKSPRAGGMFVLMLMALALPSYVLYYAWSLPLDPTTELGGRLAGQPQIARAIGMTGSAMVLCLWHWPIAAMLIGQGFRRIGPMVMERARLEAPEGTRFFRITLPLLSGAVMPAFVICSVLVAVEYTTFHLSGARTIGTELGLVYQTTGSASAVARAGWPMLIAALGAGAVLAGTAAQWQNGNEIAAMEKRKSPKRMWIFFGVLCFISWLLPMGIMAGAVRTARPFREYLMLHADELGWSILIGLVTAVMSLLVSKGIFSLSRRFKVVPGLCICLYASVFAGMLLPGSALAAGLLEICSAVPVFNGLRESWMMVCLGQTGRLAGVVLITLILIRQDGVAALLERAKIEGLSGFKLWWTVQRPFTLGLLIGTFLLVMMLSVTEIPATMLLLPAGLPNFAQRLLNQMHYARDQQVIASCLILAGLFVVLAGLAAMCLNRIGRLSKAYGVIMCLLLAGHLVGCKPQSGQAEPETMELFGKTGRGHGEFVYPRAIDMLPDGCVIVVDKTARIQRFTQEGVFCREFQLPEFEAGKPTGVSVSPDGRIFVADTHYHRVMIFDAEGRILGQFGQYGKEDGQFIYPTDVAFGPDGRIYVSEYGGNDRISVFDGQFRFLFAFGSMGEQSNQFIRPQALCADWKRGILYVADACNHRIVIYDFDGNLKTSFGSAGTGSGQLRYPYGLALLSDGGLAVSEYGNNRIQIFDAQRQSGVILGVAGRDAGQLAFPWGIVADPGKALYIVDAGNNRIQKWKIQ
jgi:ABC-type Fe3+ transport system permease subunit